MAINVNIYYNMSKDVNSTALPGGGNFTNMATFPCALFEPCSIVRPILRLQIAGATLKSANYAYIAEFGRYYWINDIEYRDGYWYLYLSCDTLATYKSQIGQTSQYVLRSQSDKNENIIDTLYVPVGGNSSAFNSAPVGPFTDSLASGTFIIGVTSASPNMGSTRYIAMNYGQMTAFLSLLMGTGDYLNLDDSELDSTTAKIILNPIQYIQSVQWFPFSVSGTSANQIFFGWWLIDNVQFTDINNPQNLRKSVQFSLPIPKHPQAATRGAYLNLSPYSQYRLLLPVIGSIELPASLMYDMGAIRAEYIVDLVTGRAEIDVYAYDTAPGADRERRLLHTTCELGIEIPVAQITRDTISATRVGANSLISGVAGIATGNIMGGISTLVNGAIDAAIATQTPIPSFMGAPGNLTSYAIRPTITNISQEISEDANALFGAPLCQNKIINTLSGFIMCGRAHIQIPGATRAEMDEIESFMNGGFRYE